MAGESCIAPSLHAYVVPPVLAPAGVAPRLDVQRRSGLLRSAFVLAVAALAILSLVIGYAHSVGRLAGAPSRDPVEFVLQSVAEIHVRGAQASGIVQTALGTGVVMDRDGLIVTNDHVITMAGLTEGGNVIVVAADGREATGLVVARLPERDLAFIRIALDGLVPAEFATDLEHVELADPVFSVGAPGEFEQPVSEGMVTDVLENVAVPQRPDLDTLIESSTQLQQGFSGGPLVDAEGRVLGINVATLGVAESQTMGLAIPSRLVLEAAAWISAPVPERAPPARKTPQLVRSGNLRTW